MVLGSEIRDAGSGKNLFRIPDPGSPRGQKSTGSRIRNTAGGKFATDVNETGGKFATGVNEAGGNENNYQTLTT
jgi:hypothetical protein